MESAQRKRPSEEPASDGTGPTKKTNTHNGNGISHVESAEEEGPTDAQGTMGIKNGNLVADVSCDNGVTETEFVTKIDSTIAGHSNGDLSAVGKEKVMSMADLLKIPEEYRNNGLKIVKMRIPRTEDEFLTDETLPQDFNPEYVYQYFKEPGDTEAAEEMKEEEADADRDALDGEDEAEEDKPESEDSPVMLPDENEGLIVGYKDLSIKLFFTPASLKPFVRVAFDARLPSNQCSVPDIVQAIEGVYGHKVLTTTDAMRKAIQNDLKFAPFGRMIQEYTVTLPNNVQKSVELFEVGHDSQSVGYPARFPEYLNLIQPVLQWFVYAANIITADNANWLHYFLYEKSTDESHFLLGYCSVYRYPVWPKSGENKDWVPDPMQRCRIAQFLILPPYQKMGHGSKMLNAIIRRLQENPNTYEITVEDPTPKFQNIFDTVATCLVREYVTSTPSLSLEVQQPLSPATLKQLHKNLKLSPETLKFALGVLACSTARRAGQQAVQDYYENFTNTVLKKVEDTIGNLDRSWNRVNHGCYYFSEDEFTGDTKKKMTMAGWKLNYDNQKEKEEKNLTPDRIAAIVEKMSQRTMHVTKRIDELA